MINAPVSGSVEPTSSRTVLSVTPSDFIVLSHVLCTSLVRSSEPSVSLPLVLRSCCSTYERGNESIMVTAVPLIETVMLSPGCCD